MQVDVKKILIKPISSDVTKKGVLKWHYSGKVVTNSTLHFGAFYNDVLCGVMSFGPSMDKRKLIGLVRDTKWNGFIELNRMAFSDVLPKNSESRCISVALKLIKKHYPNIEWVVSFADGTQCGDGTIYRASGFVLTQIKKNTTILESPTGEKVSLLTLDTSPAKWAVKYGLDPRFANSKTFKESAGFKRSQGFMLRYVFFLNPEARKRLTVEEIPFSKIKEMHASMYRGKSTD